VEIDTELFTNFSNFTKNDDAAAVRRELDLFKLYK